jgi:transposase
MRKPTLSLTNSEVNKETLLAFARTVPGAWIGIKIAALLLLIEGQRPGWIGTVLGLNRMSLSRWIHGINQSGLSALQPQIRPGRPTRLTSSMQKELASHLEKSPVEFGLNRAHWDGPTVAVHLKRQFGLKLTVRHAQRWMHQLGYRLKKASYAYLQAQKDEALGFQKSLKKTEKPGSKGNRGFSG